jgi:hypothetical protein
VTVLVVAAILFPVLIWGVYRAQLSNSNDVRDWLPAEYPETQQYRWFARHFGTHDFVLVSWPGCTLQDPRLDEFAGQLSKRTRRAADGASLGQIFTGRSLLEQLTAPPIELSERRANSRLRGAVIGPDAQQTCAVVMLPDAAARRLEPSFELILQAAESVGVPRGEVRMGGVPVINAALNRESTNSLLRLAGLSGVLGLVIAWFCFRELRLTTLVIGVGVYSAAASLSVVPLAGVPMNAILITMVPLVYVAALSGAIHLTNYYLDAVQHSGPLQAPGRALARAAMPLLLAAVTTMFGLLSLGFSDLNPIRLFGIFSAVGVAIGFAAQVLILPAALVVWKPRVSSASGRLKRDAAGPASHLGLWPKLGRSVVEHPHIVLFVYLLVVGVGATGLPKLRTSIQMMRLFSSSSPVIPMTRWLEENLGATIPLEVVVRFRPESDTSVVDRMRLVAALSGRLRGLPGASGCLSAATFAPSAVTSSAHLGIVERAYINTKLKRSSNLLRESGWLAQDGNEELWRISLRVRGIEDLDYDALVTTIRNSINPLLDEQLGDGRAGVDVVVTGTAPIVFKARRSLLEGMLFGLGTDVTLIVIGVIAITRSWMSGIVMLVLSVAPTTLVFGTMGLLGVVVDIGSAMTPCIAVGVTVDDGIHLLLCHRQGIRNGLSLPHATLFAYDTCGRAIVQSWGIIGIALAAFALSSFVPTFRFGLLMFFLLTVSMLTNLLFLPALLAGPIGRWIAPHTPPMEAGTGPALPANAPSPDIP